MSVHAVMTANPACCSPSTPLRLVAAMMKENDCGQIPVVNEDGSGRPVGVVTDRDISIRMVAIGRNPLDATAQDCMSTPCITISADSSLDDCCEAMESAKVRRLPVVDGEGRLCGIVALADIARHANAAATVEVVKEVSAAG